MKLRNLNNPLLALACMVLVAVPGIATATLDGPDTGDNSIMVSFSDLDLNKMDGINTLYQRLRTSARKVCGGKQGVETIDRTIQRKQCFDTALTEAVKNINNKLLLHLHQDGTIE